MIDKFKDSSDDNFFVDSDYTCLEDWININDSSINLEIVSREEFDKLWNIFFVFKKNKKNILCLSEENKKNILCLPEDLKKIELLNIIYSIEKKIWFKNQWLLDKLLSKIKLTIAFAIKNDFINWQDVSENVEKYWIDNDLIKRISDITIRPNQDNKDLIKDLRKIKTESQFNIYEILSKDIDLAFYDMIFSVWKYNIINIFKWKFFWENGFNRAKKELLKFKKIWDIEWMIDFQIYLIELIIHDLCLMEYSDDLGIWQDPTFISLIKSFNCLGGSFILHVFLKEFGIKHDFVDIYMNWDNDSFKGHSVILWYIGDKTYIMDSINGTFTEIEINDKIKKWNVIINWNQQYMIWNDDKLSLSSLFLSQWYKYYLNKMNENALLFYLKSIEIFPDNLYAQFNIWLIYYDLWKYKESLTYFDKVLKINPLFIDAVMSKWNIYADLWQYKKAKKCLDKVVKKSPEYWRAWYNRWLLYENMWYDDKDILLNYLESAFIILWNSKLINNKIDYDVFFNIWETFKRLKKLKNYKLFNFIWKYLRWDDLKNYPKFKCKELIRDMLEKEQYGHLLKIVKILIIN